jgi:hypothetical protein
MPLYCCPTLPFRGWNMGELHNCLLAIAVFVASTLPSKSTLADVLTDLKTAYCYTLYNNRLSSSKLPDGQRPSVQKKLATLTPLFSDAIRRSEGKLTTTAIEMEVQAAAIVRGSVLPKPS